MLVTAISGDSGKRAGLNLGRQDLVIMALMVLMVLSTKERVLVI